MEPAPFRFRLDRLRNLRAQAEEAARVRLAGALNDVTDGHASAAAVRDQLAEARAKHAAAASAGKGCSGNDLLAMQVYRERLEVAEVEAANELARRQRVATQRRAEAVIASRDRQALDRLEQRRRAEHAVMAERARNAALDDIASALHARRTA